MALHYGERRHQECYNQGVTIALLPIPIYRKVHQPREVQILEYSSYYTYHVFNKLMIVSTNGSQLVNIEGIYIYNLKKQNKTIAMSLTVS